MKTIIVNEETNKMEKIVGKEGDKTGEVGSEKQDSENQNREAGTETIQGEQRDEQGKERTSEGNRSEEERQKGKRKKGQEISESDKANAITVDMPPPKGTIRRTSLNRPGQ